MEFNFVSQPAPSAKANKRPGNNGGSTGKRRRGRGGGQKNGGQRKRRHREDAGRGGGRNHHRGNEGRGFRQSKHERNRSKRKRAPHVQTVAVRDPTVDDNADVANLVAQAQEADSEAVLRSNQKNPRNDPSNAVVEVGGIESAATVPKSAGEIATAETVLNISGAGSQPVVAVPEESTSDGFGSRSKPAALKYTDILREANSTLRHEGIRRTSQPLRSSTSDHIFSGETWEQIGLDARLIRHVQSALKLETPTLVQRKAIPTLMSGVDTVVKSETGSGKTMAYLLPMVNSLASTVPRIERKDGTRALILLPTRELAAQVLSRVQRLCRPMPWLVCGCVSGGERPKSEKARLRKGVPILVCTPGRLLYHLRNSQSFCTAELEWLILDEADRLMDLGFEQQLKDLLAELMDRHKQTMSGREGYPWQTALLSATQSESVSSLAGTALSRPHYIDASSTAAELGSTYQIPKQLTQHAALIDSPHRLVALLRFLRSQVTRGSSCRVIVFMSTCATVDFHFQLIAAMSKVRGGDKVAAGLADVADLAAPLRGNIYRLHGDVEQSQRSKTLKDYCNSEVGILLCTDVAARGLDMPEVQWIIQFDSPAETSEYVHRIGRTARRGAAGSALLMLRPCEAKYLTLLKQHGMNLVELAESALLDGLCDSHHGLAGGSRRREVSSRRSRQMQLMVERMVSDSEQLMSLACDAYHSWVRAYSCHAKDCRQIFNVRRLHLGHVAKSFGLRDPPTKIASRMRERKAGKRSRSTISSGQGAETGTRGRAPTDTGAGVKGKKGKKGRTLQKSSSRKSEKASAPASAAERALAAALAGGATYDAHDALEAMGAGGSGNRADANGSHRFAAAASRAASATVSEFGA